jgi:hypothetical protein
MAMSHSSTSNSDEPWPVGRTPWALLIALAVVLLAEVTARLLSPTWVIPYENTGRNAYSAVRQHLHATGAAEVGFLGSSRGREAIVAPLVRELAAAELGRDLRVGNYSSPAGAVDENEMITRLVFRAGEPHPRMLLLGLSPLEMSVEALETDHAGELWEFQDWLRAVRRNLDSYYNEPPGRMRGIPRSERREIRRETPRRLNTILRLELLPEVIRNEIERVSALFAYRDRARLIGREWFTSFRTPPCPIAGDLTESQAFKAERTIDSLRVTAEFVQRYLAKRMDEERHPMGGRQTENLRSIIKQCREHGTMIVMYELPLSAILKQHYPEGTFDEFKRLVRSIGAEEKTPFVELDDLGLSFDDSHFRDHSHMNMPGAERLTSAIVEQVIAPMLAGREDGARWIPHAP